MPIPIYVQTVASSATTAQLISYPAQNRNTAAGLQLVLITGDITPARLEIEGQKLTRSRSRAGIEGAIDTSSPFLIAHFASFNYSARSCAIKIAYDLSMEIRERLSSRETVTRAVLPACGIIIFSRISRHRRPL